MMTQELSGPAISGQVVTITRDTLEPIPPPPGPTVTLREDPHFEEEILVATYSMPFWVPPGVLPNKVTPPSADQWGRLFANAIMKALGDGSQINTCALEIIPLIVPSAIGNRSFIVGDREVYYGVGGSNTLNRNNNIPPSGSLEHRAPWLPHDNLAERFEDMRKEMREMKQRLEGNVLNPPKDLLVTARWGAARPQVQSASNPKKNIRGCTRGIALRKLNKKNNNEKLVIHIDPEQGRPVDSVESAKLSRELGQISRESL
ncbi:hypothetical protein BUALT_Bualt01G0195700 [Buddleja alternifolia]|uniref:Uncharacterized protein n=1 Tax=Buddleja alternifolia TaxID=168488 RepID=A0AAV6YJB4_9LAMI|nr:hypothetical protein BUALT_Bualt01G0195700 [Buddleja alternifolia]